MSVLSDQDIIRELGKGILIHPLKPGSIKSCDLGLTASEYAYAIGKKERLVIDSEQKADNPNEQQKFFYIPPRDTALVWTDESIYLSNKFRGPLYSIVSQVSRGMGHIGTRVNPCWSGVLCIALHNISDEPLRINVRDVKQPIVYLAVEKLSSRSSHNRNIDKPARLDVIRGLPNAQEIYDYFNQPDHDWMTGVTDSLKHLMLSSNEYKQLKRGIHNTFLSYLGSDTPTKWATVAALGSILSGFFTALTYISTISPPDKNPKIIQPPTTQVKPRITVSPESNN